MPRNTRASILARLEEIYQGRVLSYVTGDRPGLETQVSLDQLVRFRRHLESIGDVEHIVLVIHTGGGNTNMPWPMINMIRAHTSRITAAVPYRAHSAGTLICLGADLISLTRYGTISPIDPTVANQFNPQDPVAPQNRLPIAVEDVQSYIELISSEHWSDAAREHALNRLTEQVHPLALGNVQRNVNQIRKLASQMIRLGRPALPAEEIDQLVSSLTTSFYTHVHLINHVEAATLSLPIEKAEGDKEQALLAYYDALVEDLSLHDQFDVPGLARAAGGAQMNVELERAYIETTDTCDAFVTSGVIRQQVMPMPVQPGVPGQMQLPAMGQQAAIAFEVLTERWQQRDSEPGPGSAPDPAVGSQADPPPGKA